MSGAGRSTCRMHVYTKREGPRRGPTSLVGTVHVRGGVLAVDREVFDVLLFSRPDRFVDGVERSDQVFLDAVEFVIQFEHVTFLPER